MSTEIREQFTIYLPVELKEQLRAEAKENFRSLNSHLMFILNSHFKVQSNDE